MCKTKNTDFELSVESDDLEAYLTINPDVEDDVTLESAMQYLKESKIVQGIFKNTLNRAITDKAWGRKFKIAQGKKPINGENGRADYKFETESYLTPTLQSDGTVDYRDLKVIQNVKKGDLLAEILPPMPGSEGINVYGNAVVPSFGVPVEVVSGLNTEFEDPEKTKIIATADGHVKLKRNNIVEVDTVYNVDGDVDFSTGNLDVTGDVFISGEVRAGFSVKASGDIVIQGAVEDSDVKASGNVVVHGGFTGSGKGKIMADGDVLVLYVDRQRIIARGSIYVKEEALHAHLVAEDRIVVNHGKGILIGGTSKAGNAIEVKNFGSEQQVLTKAMVAEDAEMVVAFEGLESRLEIANEKYELLTIKMCGILNQVFHLGWEKRHANRYKQLEDQLPEVLDTKYQTVDELTSIEKELRAGAKNGYLRINRRIYPGSEIRLGGLTKSIKHEMGPCEFSLYEDGIHDRKL